MLKKIYLSELNRRREVQRRVRFVKERMYAMPAELSFAQGNLKELPRSLQAPPRWALRSACLAWETGFKGLRKVLPEAGKPLAEGDIWELFGVFQSMVCFMNSPAADTVEAESDVPELATVRKPFARALAKKFQALVAKLKRNTGRNIAMPKLEELVARQTRYQAGLTGFVTPEGDLPGLKTLTAQIYNLIWFLWPEIKGDFTAPWLQTFLREQCAIKASDKLFEKIVTEIRKL